MDHKTVNSKWFNLEKPSLADTEPKKKEIKFVSRIHLRLCLDGGYHVLDESTHYSSDLRPTAKQLWKPSIGVLEVGILSAHEDQRWMRPEHRGEKIWNGWTSLFVKARSMAQLRLGLLPQKRPSNTSLLRSKIWHWSSREHTGTAGHARLRGCGGISERMGGGVNYVHKKVYQLMLNLFFSLMAKD